MFKNTNRGKQQKEMFQQLFDSFLFTCVSFCGGILVNICRQEKNNSTALRAYFGYNPPKQNKIISSNRLIDRNQNR